MSQLDGVQMYRTTEYSDDSKKKLKQTDSQKKIMSACETLPFCVIVVGCYFLVIHSTLCCFNFVFLNIDLLNNKSTIPTCA